MSALAPASVVEFAPAAELRPAGLCPWEDEEAFRTLRGSFRAAYQPHGPAEDALLDRMIWIEWRRKRLLAAEAAVHVAHAIDRADDSQAKIKTLKRAGFTDYRVRDEISIAEILRGSDEDDRETIEAVREGVADVEATLSLIEEGSPLEQAVARLDEDMRGWWNDALEETDDDGKRKYEATPEGLGKFLREDGAPWRCSWLAVNEIRPAIRAQAIAESLDPQRVGRLWDMEARLDRQFEKALSMLIRLQDIRGQ